MLTGVTESESRVAGAGAADGVRLRPEAAERFGLTPGHVRRATTTLLRGNKVGEVYEGQKRFAGRGLGVPHLGTTWRRCNPC